MKNFVDKFSSEKSKKEFVVSNLGKINPMNDNANPNEVIKPINIKNLMGADEDEQ
jgi:hypothetical protein